MTTTAAAATATATAAAVGVGPGGEECANCKRLEESKLRLVRNTALELERMRQFIVLLSAALQGYGYTQRDIQRIENGLINNNNNNNNSSSSSSSSKYNKNKNNNKDKDKDKDKKNNKNDHNHSSNSKKGTINNTKSISPIPHSSSSLSSSSKSNNEVKSSSKALSREPQRLERKQSLEMLDEMLNKNNFHAELEKDQTKKTTTTTTNTNTTTITTNKENISSSKNTLENQPETEVKAMSVKERMAALKQNITQVDENQEKKMNELKRERGFQHVEASTDKANIANLFQQRLKKQKEGDVININNQEDGGNGGGNNGISLKEVLKNPEIKGTDAQQLMTSMNIFQAMEKKPDFNSSGNHKVDSPASTPDPSTQTNTQEQQQQQPAASEKLELLNMNNSAIMNKMSETEKENMEALICSGIINNKDLKVVQMCNANVDDKFFIKILDTLTENSTSVQELWFENNPIGDQGMQRLAQFIRTDKQITVMKFYSNKKTISTPILEDLCKSLMDNQTLLKFVFDGFRFSHQKDTVDKALKRNHALARQKKKT